MQKIIKNAIRCNWCGDIIRDGDWATKKSGKGINKPGLDACAKGLATLSAALSEAEWTEEKIDTRAKWLFEIAKTLWKI